MQSTKLARSLSRSLALSLVPMMTMSEGNDEDCVSLVGLCTFSDVVVNAAAVSFVNDTQQQQQRQQQQKRAPYFEVFDRNVGHDNGEFDELNNQS